MANDGLVRKHVHRYETSRFSEIYVDIPPKEFINIQKNAYQHIILQIR